MSEPTPTSTIASHQGCYAVYPDGNSWCATGKGFINLQESPAGFGDNPVAALQALLSEEARIEVRRCEGLRRWKCNNCETKFERGMVAVGKAPPCPRCKAGNQYVYEV